MNDLRGLIWTLVRTDFKVRYHGTAMGFLWALLKPLAMLAVLLAVFSLVFASDPSYRHDLVVGLFLWDFFAEGTKVGLGSLHSKGYLLTKSRFPSWVIVLTSSSNALVTLFVFALGLIAVLLGGPAPPSVQGILLFFGYCLALITIVLGFSLGASVLFLRYRDLNQVWEVMTNAGFFLAPVVYPLEVLPERAHFWLYLWPPTAIIQFSRAVLVDGQVPSLRAHVLLVVMALSILAVGGLLFRRLAPRALEKL